MFSLLFYGVRSTAQVRQLRLDRSNAAQGGVDYFNPIAPISWPIFPPSPLNILAPETQKLRTVSMNDQARNGLDYRGLIEGTDSFSTIRKPVSPSWASTRVRFGV